MNQIGGSLTVYFSDHPIEDYADAKNTDSERFGRFFKAMLDEGINLAPSKYEAWFLTIMHTQKILMKPKKRLIKLFLNFLEITAICFNIILIFKLFTINSLLIVSE